MTCMSCATFHILPGLSSRSVTGSLPHIREIISGGGAHSLHVPFLPREMCVTVMSVDRLVVRRACDFFAWFCSLGVAEGAGVLVWFDQLHGVFLFLFHGIHVL
ncbi:MAG: hypothetical protein LUQ25_08795 [Methanoregulaceae archaeon]|nr:hypothetical protein [Methanoregulaceae archaeon]